MRLKTFATATAMLALGTGLAFADCPDRSAAAQTPGATGAAGNQGAGSGRIAKDGTTAPLQQPGSTGASGSSTTQGSGTTAGASGSMGSGSMGSGSMGSGSTASGSMGSASGTGSSSTTMSSQGDTSGSGGQQDGVAKDGTTMPLAQNRGGGDANRAMSGQDVQAQQQGQPTAQAKATDC